MSAKFKVLELLNTSEVEELEKFCRERSRTVDEVHEWLQAEGFTLSRNACWNWKKEFDGLVMKERFSRSGELARAIKDAVGKGSFEDVAEAAVMNLTQAVFEQSAMLQAEGKIDPDELQSMSKTINNLVGGKRELAQYKLDVKEAIAAGEKIAKEGGSAESVVDKVRQILGIKEAA
jgi:hypothetical protein